MSQSSQPLPADTQAPSQIPGEVSEDLEIEQKQTKEDLTPTNQTAFGSHEPLLESISDYTEPLVAGGSAKGNKKVIVMAGSFLFVIVFLLIGLAYMASRNSGPAPVAQDTISPTPVAETDPIKKRIRNLEALLETADPTRQEDPFPPVQMEAILDKQEK